MTRNKETHYKVKNKVFKTLEEASAYANEYLRLNRIVLNIEATKRQVTHIYVFPESEDK